MNYEVNYDDNHLVITKTKKWSRDLVCTRCYNLYELTYTK